MAPPVVPCCQTFTDVLTGPGGGAEPTVFLDDNNVPTMVICMVDTPGGLGLYDHAVRFCPFCGTEIRTAAETKAKATP